MTKTLLDPTLTLKAKGVLAVLSTLNAIGVKTSLVDVQRQSADGIDSTRTGMNELLKAGLVTRRENRGADGRRESVTYHTRIDAE